MPAPRHVKHDGTALTDLFAVVRRFVEAETERDDGGNNENDEGHVLRRFPDELQKQLRPLGGKRVGTEPLATRLQVVRVHLL